MEITIMRHWNCIDVEQFNQDMAGSSGGKTRGTAGIITLSRASGNIRAISCSLGTEDILVIEGIHCLNDDLSYSLPSDEQI